MMPRCAQCDRLLRALKEAPRTKLYIINVLGVLNAGGRVYDLRGMGHDIETQMITVRNASGDKARVAQYVYKGRMSNTMQRVA